MIDIKKEILNKEYDFLRNDVKLKDNICFLTLGGSHAYGTNIEGSDVDVRGVSLNIKQDLIGLSTFEQKVEENTDTTIYSFMKFIKLIMNCNPNTIELLGCKPESYIICNEIGKELLEKKNMFLSKRAVYSFGGFATAQLKRLQNALSHDTYTEEQRNNHLSRTLENTLNCFSKKYEKFNYGKIKLTQGEDGIKFSGSFEEYPLNNLSSILTEMKDITKTYEKLNGRNSKKDDKHLCKHFMHLIRLYLMAFDILEKGEINTYREDDIPFLLDIRNGKYLKEDGTFDSCLFDIVDKYEKRLKYDMLHTSLPETPDYKKIEEWVISVNERIIKGEIKQYGNI